MNSNPYQTYFEARTFDQFDACDFFTFYKYPTRHRQMATEEWEKKVIPFVEKESVKHAKRLRATFKATGAVRNDFWDGKRRFEEQSKHKNALLSDARESLRDVSKLAVAIVKNEVADDIKELIGPRKRGRSSSPLEFGSDEESNNEDIEANLVRANGRPLGDVLNAPPFIFEAKFGSDDLGLLFTRYYDDSRKIKGFNPKQATDVIALTGVLCLCDPTETQTDLLGSMVPILKKQIKLPSRDVKAERATVRAWWELWNDKHEDEEEQEEEEGKDDAAEQTPREQTPRELAKGAILDCRASCTGQLLDSLWRMHMTLFSNLNTLPVVHFSEVNGMASFLCPFLTPLLQIPDVVLFSCANTMTKASSFLQSLQSSRSRSQDGLKRPDIIGQFYKDDLEVYFGEIAGVDDHDKCKIAIDLIRIAIWARKSAERILHSYGVKVSLLGLQVIGREITFYKFTWCGNILVMTIIGQMVFPTSLLEMEAIASKVRVWADVQKTLSETCQALKRAKKLQTPGPYTGFPGLYTPSCHSFKQKSFAIPPP